MTALPNLTAHHSIGPTRFTRTRLTRCGPAVGDYRLTQPVKKGDMWRIMITDPRGEAVGKVNLKPHSDGRMAIYDLYVNAPHRGQKLSRKLMTRAAQQARALGGRSLWLEADANPGEGLDNQKLYNIYRNMGFRKTRINPDTGRQEMEAPLYPSYAIGRG